MARSAGFAGRLGWSVGIHSWLDREESKVDRYWRVIEFGSAATRWPWEGQTIVGLWGNRAEPRKGLIAGGLDPFQNGREDQKFVPFFGKIGASPEELERAGRAALWSLTRGGTDLGMFRARAWTGENRARKGLRGSGETEWEKRRLFYWLMNKATLEQMPFVSGVVQRAVPAGDFYLRAMASFDPMQTELDVLRQEISSVIGGLAIASSRGLSAARERVAMDSGGNPRTGRRRAEIGQNAQGVRRLSQLSGVGTSGMAHLPQVRGPLISVVASASVQDFIRDGSGRFSNGAWIDMVTTVNRRVAEAFQQEVVRLMRQERKRPPTGNLIKATAHPNNRIPR